MATITVTMPKVPSPDNHDPAVFPAVTVSGGGTPASPPGSGTPASIVTLAFPDDGATNVINLKGSREMLSQFVRILLLAMTAT